MSYNIVEDIKKSLKIKQNIIIDFKDIYGLTLVFISKITLIDDKITSGEIAPAGIIYKKDDEIYFAPLDNVGNLEAIVEKYVENYMAK